jgi:hypothetical protein
MVSVPPIKMVILGWPFQVPKLELPTIRKVYVRANSGTTIFFHVEELCNRAALKGMRLVSEPQMVQTWLRTELSHAMRFEPI